MTTQVAFQGYYELAGGRLGGKTPHDLRVHRAPCGRPLRTRIPTIWGVRRPPYSSNTVDIQFEARPGRPSGQKVGTGGEAEATGHVLDPSALLKIVKTVFYRS